MALVNVRHLASEIRQLVQFPEHFTQHGYRPIYTFEVWKFIKNYNYPQLSYQARQELKQALKDEGITVISPEHPFWTSPTYPITIQIPVECEL